MYVCIDYRNKFSVEGQIGITDVRVRYVALKTMGRFPFHNKTN